MKPVKISRLIRNLKEIMEEHGDLTCVFSIDDEGNAFHPVYWDPTLGQYNMRDYEYMSEEDLQEMKEDDPYFKLSKDQWEKVVCIN